MRAGNRPMDVAADDVMQISCTGDHFVECVIVAEFDRVHRSEPGLHRRMMHEDDAGFWAVRQSFLQPRKPVLTQFASMRRRVGVGRPEKRIEQDQAGIQRVDEALDKAVPINGCRGEYRKKIGSIVVVADE